MTPRSPRKLGEVHISNETCTRDRLVDSSWRISSFLLLYSLMTQFRIVFADLIRYFSRTGERRRSRSRKESCSIIRRATSEMTINRIRKALNLSRLNCVRRFAEEGFEIAAAVCKPIIVGMVCSGLEGGLNLSILCFSNRCAPAGCGVSVIALRNLVLYLSVQQISQRQCRLLLLSRSSFPY